MVVELVVVLGKPFTLKSIIDLEAEALDGLTMVTVARPVMIEVVVAVVVTGAVV
jgi:hypothetical protein